MLFYLCPLLGFDAALFQFLKSRSRQQPLLQANGDQITLQVLRRGVEATRPVNPETFRNDKNALKVTISFRGSRICPLLQVLRCGVEAARLVDPESFRYDQRHSIFS